MSRVMMEKIRIAMIASKMKMNITWVAVDVHAVREVAEEVTMILTTCRPDQTRALRTKRSMLRVDGRRRKTRLDG